MRFDPNKSLEEHAEEHLETNPIDQEDAMELLDDSKAYNSPTTNDEESPEKPNDKQD